MIGKIQKQRGLTAIFISSNQQNLGSVQKLGAANIDVLTEIVALSNWFELHIAEEKVFKTKDGLIKYIRDFNDDVFSRNTINLKSAIEFYTNINMALLDLMASRISVPEHDRLLVALDALLRATDAVGVQRALGSAYWSNCEFEGSIIEFTSLQSKEETYLNQLFRYYELSEQKYADGLRALQPLDSLIKEYATNMTNPAYAETCLQIPPDDRYDISDHWFDNISTYMTHLNKVQVSLVDVLLDQINNTMNKAKVEVY